MSTTPAQFAQQLTQILLNVAKTAAVAGGTGFGLYFGYQYSQANFSRVKAVGTDGGGVATDHSDVRIDNSILNFSPGAAVADATERQLKALDGGFITPLMAQQARHDSAMLVHSKMQLVQAAQAAEQQRLQAVEQARIHKEEAVEIAAKEVEKAEKVAAKEVEKAAKEAEKAEKVAAKEVEKAAKEVEKAAKEVEKAAKEVEKAAKEAEKAEKVAVQRSWQVAYVAGAAALIAFFISPKK